MKKYFKTSAVCIMMVGFFTIIACDKDDSHEHLASLPSSLFENLPISTDTDFSNFTITAVSGENLEFVDVYHPSDGNSVLWTWHRTENGRFIFDMDFIWEFTDELYTMGEDGNGGYIVGLEGGDEVRITDIVVSGSHTSLTITYESGEKCQIDIDLPIETDIINALQCFAAGADMSMCSDGPIGKLIKKVVDVMREYFRQKDLCYQKVLEHAEICRQHGCTPSIHQYYITCISLNQQNNCSNYTWTCQ